ncbi:hypothetical protein DWU95_35565, partial [Burkholderia contaminans]
MPHARANMELVAPSRLRLIGTTCRCSQVRTHSARSPALTDATRPGWLPPPCPIGISPAAPNCTTRPCTCTCNSEGNNS